VTVEHAADKHSFVRADRIVSLHSNVKTESDDTFIEVELWMDDGRHIVFVARDDERLAALMETIEDALS
jgi:hypothetical protein